MNSRAPKILIISLFFLFSAFPAQAVNSLDVVINEIAWMGTDISANDEWIELYNNTENPVNLDGWQLTAQDGTPKINLSGTIPTHGFHLLERTDDNSVPNIPADQIYTGALSNTGENLGLYDNLGNLIDSVNASAGWPAGDNSTKQTMERKINTNWQTSQNPGGTPKAKNSEPPPGQELQAKPNEPIIETVEDSLQQTDQRGKEQLGALAEPFQQALTEQVSKSLFIFLIALGLAVFSGTMILILKRRIKTGYNK